MEPTNNESMRKVVVHRKIRQNLVTVGRKTMFGAIMTCLLMSVTLVRQAGAELVRKTVRSVLGYSTCYTKGTATAKSECVISD